MAYFGTSASTPGILAELLIAAMNTNGLHWKTSPAVAELEQVAMGWLRQWLGPAAGVFRHHLRHGLHQHHARAHLRPRIRAAGDAA